MKKRYQTSIRPFDIFNNQQIYQYKLQNDNGVCISVLNLGGILYEITIPTKKGPRNLVLNYPNSTDYFDNPFYVCMAIGRTAGRISNAEFQLNGHSYKLLPNEGTTLLHGGPHGFNSQVWSGELTTRHGIPAIHLTRIQRPEDDGFPGILQTSIYYQLSEDNTITIEFVGTSDADSLFNPTLHTYFNLGSDNTILQHTLQINSTRRLLTLPNKVPTGQFLSTTSTPFDFHQSRQLGFAINQLKNTQEKGLDDVFDVQPDDNNIVATLNDPTSNTSVAIESARNGLVVFTANSFTHSHMNFIRTNGTGNPYLGVALEAQNLPDATKHAQFGTTILRAGETKTEQIKYHLSFEKTQNSI
ncbi:aldose epimerase family protein [Furfurilactobacillus curtus]|uniref:Maltose epimerase n=1 Tax=Furfurilactobacillus curtus TaxID=1746200 RepID=A0ABQ5JMS9_9LACO